MLKKISITLVFYLMFGLSYSFASWEQKPEASLMQGFRYDIRQRNHKLYLSRVSLNFDYLGKEEKSLLSLRPFFEIRRNIDKCLWEREELGVEVGKDIFPWFYLGESIQMGWMKEDYQQYKMYEKRNYTELETKILFSHNLLPDRFVKLKGFVLNEYTFNFNSGEPERNEVVAGVSLPVGQYLKTDLNWRHIDRIHYYDSDTFEASMTFTF